MYKFKLFLTNQELTKSPDTLTEYRLKWVTELIINDFNNVRGTDIHPPDPNYFSLDRKQENYPFFLETTFNVNL